MRRSSEAYWLDLKNFLDAKVDEFNRPAFIEDDPVSIPHRFTRLQDIEIAGLFAAVLAWGQRKTIINKTTELLARMDNDPYLFVQGLTPRSLKSFDTFRHRTFNPVDARYFVTFLHHFYKEHVSLEEAFAISASDENVEQGLRRFHDQFFSLPEAPARTQKHLATPARKSACKRINMFLRWMVRNDQRGVDFGLWKTISPAQLICPCDLHVERVARRLKLIRRKPVDWLTAVELTNNLRRLDPADPVKYDFALFGLGVSGEV